MASNQILKKSLVGGFKKDGVLNYVEQLQAEILELKQELGNREAESENNERLKAALEEKDAQIEALKSEIEELKAQNSVQSQEHEKTVKQCQTDYEEKIQMYDTKIAAIEEKFAAIESGCTRLGESDKIVSQAKAKADALTAKANEAVKQAADELADVYNAFKTACVNYDSSSLALKNRIEALMDTLSSITVEAETEE